MMTDWTIIRVSLRARLFSTVTTILLVAVASGLMLVLLSMRSAGRRAFERSSGNMQLLVSADSSPLNSVLNSLFYASAPTRSFKWTTYGDILKKYPFEYSIPVQLGDTYRSFPVVATNDEFFQKYSPDPDHGWSLREGAFFGGDFELVAGSVSAQALNLKLGKTFPLTHGSSELDDDDTDASAASASPYPTLNQALALKHRYKEYKVVGILKPTGTSHDRALFVPLTSAWIIHAHDKRRQKDPSITQTTVDDLKDDDKLVTGAYLRCQTPPGMKESPVLPHVYDDLRRNYPMMTVAFPAQEIERLFAIVSNIDQLFLALGAVVMFCSGVAILLALYNSMEQRRRQVAVLRVLGCSRPRVFGLVVTEAAIIGLIGAVVAVVFALAANNVARWALSRKLGLLIEPSLLGSETMIVIVATVLLASLAGIVPAVMAYRTPLIQSLRPAA